MPGRSRRGAVVRLEEGWGGGGVCGGGGGHAKVALRSVRVRQVSPVSRSVKTRHGSEPESRTWARSHDIGMVRSRGYSVGRSVGDDGGALLRGARLGVRGRQGGGRNVEDANDGRVRVELSHL